MIDRNDDADYEEIQNTPKRGINRPETDFDLNGKYIPKGKWHGRVKGQTCGQEKQSH